MDTLGISALLCLSLLSGVFTWWAIKHGAYFGVTMLPGVLVLALGLIVLARWSPWRGDLALSRPVLLSVYGLVGLAAWTALSGLWSPSPDVAIADAQRAAGYAICFALGLWLCNLLGPRMHLALAPVAIAGGLAGLTAAGAMLLGDDIRTYLYGDGTLQYPLGYRNATAAFFLIALWPALGLARNRELGSGWRAAALGAATISVEMALIAQSRGSTVAVAVALVVYAALTHERARALGWLAVAVLPALLVIPSMTDLYTAVNEGTLGAGRDEMRATAQAALGGLALSLALALIAIRLEGRLLATDEASKRADRFATRGLQAGLVVGLVAFVAAVGNPLAFVADKVDELRTEGSPAFEGQSSRFTFDAGTERADLWGVALEDAGSDPLFGVGAGGFQYSYTQNRSHADQNARDAHSVELEVLAELGVPGLALLTLVLAAAVSAVMRSRRLGPAAAGLATAALTATAYWLTHSSIDWFWTYAAVSAPVFMLLGAASAPAVFAPRQRRGTGRTVVVVVAAVLAVSLVPPYLSERYTNNAYRNWRSDPGRAFADLDRARSLNPFAEEPWLAEGAIARELGDAERELEALRGAAEERPQEWAVHYFLALAHLDGEPNLARRELDVALELNPLSARLGSLDDRVSAAQERRAAFIEQRAKAGRTTPAQP